MSEQQTHKVYTETMTVSLQKARYHLKGTSICIALISVWLFFAILYCSIDPELSTKYEHPLGPFAHQIASILIRPFGISAFLVCFSMLWLSVLLWRNQLVKIRFIDPILYLCFLSLSAIQVALSLPDEKLFGFYVGGTVGKEITLALEKFTSYPLFQVLLVFVMVAYYFALAPDFKLFSSEIDELDGANDKKRKNKAVKNLAPEVPVPINKPLVFLEHPALQLSVEQHEDDLFLEPEVSGVQQRYHSQNNYSLAPDQIVQPNLQVLLPLYPPPQQSQNQSIIPNPMPLGQSSPSVGTPSIPSINPLPIAYQPIYHSQSAPVLSAPTTNYLQSYLDPYQAQVVLPNLNFNYPSQNPSIPPVNILPQGSSLNARYSSYSHPPEQQQSQGIVPRIVGGYQNIYSPYAQNQGLPAVFEADKQFAAEAYISIPPVAAPPVEQGINEGDLLQFLLSELGIQSTVKYQFTGPVVSQFQIDVEYGHIGPTWQIAQYLKNSLQIQTGERHSIRVSRDIKLPQRYYIEQMVRQTRFPSVKEALQIATDRAGHEGLFLILGQKNNGEDYRLMLKNLYSMMLIGGEKVERHIGLDQIILNLVYQASPDELRMIILDPLGEDSPYHLLPHLYTPMKRAIKSIDEILTWCNSEIRRRMSLINRLGAKSFDEYNQRSPQSLYRIMLIVSDMHILSVQQLEKINQILSLLNTNHHPLGLHLLLSSRTLNPIDLQLYQNTQVRIVLPLNNPSHSAQLEAEGAESLINERDALVTQSKYAHIDDTQAVTRIHLWRLTQNTCYQLIKQCIAHAEVEYIIEDGPFMQTQGTKKATKGNLLEPNSIS